MMFGFYTSIDPKQDLPSTGLAGGGADKGEVNGFAGEGSVDRRPTRPRRG